MHLARESTVDSIKVYVEPERDSQTSTGSKVQLKVLTLRY